MVLRGALPAGNEARAVIARAQELRCQRRGTTRKGARHAAPGVPRRLQPDKTEATLASRLRHRRSYRHPKWQTSLRRETLRERQTLLRRETSRGCMQQCAATKICRRV